MELNIERLTLGVLSGSFNARFAPKVDFIIDAAQPHSRRATTPFSY